MRVLVTGGAGYIGSVCAEELLRQGYEVTIVDDLSTGHKDAVPQGAEFQCVSIGNAPPVRWLLNSKTFDAVFHFAAKALVGESMANPAAYYYTNVSAAATFLNLVKDHPKIHAKEKLEIYGKKCAVKSCPTLTLSIKGLCHDHSSTHGIWAKNRGHDWYWGVDKWLKEYSPRMGPRSCIVPGCKQLTGTSNGLCRTHHSRKLNPDGSLR